MGRRKKQLAMVDGHMPVKCPKCKENIADCILGEPPTCPYCHEIINLGNPPAAPIKEGEVKPEKQSKTLTIGTETHEATGKFTEYGIRARVIIPEVSGIEINKVSADKGKLLTKVTFTVGNINEVSLLRIIHMMGQGVKVGVNIVADKLQTDFLDIVDPVTTQTMLAQISRKDLEDRGYLMKQPTEAEIRAAVKKAESSWAKLDKLETSIPPADVNVAILAKEAADRAQEYNGDNGNGKHPESENSAATITEVKTEEVSFS
jgi:hypothetical protein